MHQFGYNSKLLETMETSAKRLVKKNMLYHANGIQRNYLNNMGEIYFMT